MANELAAPSCPQWIETAGLINPMSQWCVRIWGFHTVRGAVVRGDIRFVPE